MALLLAVCLPAAATRVRRRATAGHKTLHHHYRTLHHHYRKTHKIRGQRVMTPQRATEIQEALIREHYLQGAATGSWDTRTQTAMQKFQADNGWQTKITPDARALIKLGLGPKQDEGEYASTPSIPSAAHSLSPSAALSGPTLLPQ